jgi:hypothetical protein
VFPNGSPDRSGSGPQSLDAFKRRALKLYPREFLEQIVGCIVGTQARIHAFRELEHEATKWEVVIDEDLDPMTEGEDSRSLRHSRDHPHAPTIQ